MREAYSKMDVLGGKAGKNKVSAKSFGDTLIMNPGLDLAYQKVTWFSWRDGIPSLHFFS